MTEILPISFSSCMAAELYEFVGFKRRMGYKYNSEVKLLSQFDKFLSSLSSAEDVCEEKIHGWLRKRPNESDKTFSLRNSIYRQLYAYLESNSQNKLPRPLNVREKIMKSGFVPYIFTHDEISRLFHAADNEQPKKGMFNRCAPLIFRMLYGVGLRVNEALSLTASDVVMENGYLIIREAKNDNSRLVPMSDSLLSRLNTYLNEYEITSKNPLFPNGLNGEHLKKECVYEWFRLLLFRAGIPHRGRGFGPRMHDLRHTFAVHSLQAAIKNGADPNAYLPVLCTFLGHKNLSATERYLRLTAEVYPDVVASLDSAVGFAIPEVDDYER